MDKILTATVKFQSSLQGKSLFCGGSFFVSLGRAVKGVDVGLMVLGVVKRHDLLRDVRLESIVLVRQRWQSEGHLGSWRWWWMEEKRAGEASWFISNSR